MNKLKYQLAGLLMQLALFITPGVTVAFDGDARPLEDIEVAIGEQLDHIRDCLEVIEGELEDL